MDPLGKYPMCILFDGEAYRWVLKHWTIQLFAEILDRMGCTSPHWKITTWCPVHSKWMRLLFFASSTLLLPTFLLSSFFYFPAYFAISLARMIPVKIFNLVLLFGSVGESKLGEKQYGWNLSGYFLINSLISKIEVQWQITVILCGSAVIDQGLSILDTAQ